MRYMKFINSACAALLLTAGSAASAANLVVQDGKLTGATGVDVGGTLYDVQFIDGTCISVFNGCDDASDFDFSDVASAATAARALLDQVFVDGPSGNFDGTPSLTSGCGSPNACLVIIPYDFLIGNRVNRFSSNIASNNAIASLDAVFSGVGVRDFNFGDDNLATFVRFSLSPIAAVPEPSAWALMILGFGLVGAATRRRTAARRLLA